MIRALVPAALVIVTGCATIGRPIQWNNLQALRPGASTLEDAIRAMGRPWSVAVDAGGSTTAIWLHSHATAFTGAQAETLRLTFDREGKLVALPPVIQKDTRP